MQSIPSMLSVSVPVTLSLSHCELECVHQCSFHSHLLACDTVAPFDRVPFMSMSINTTGETMVALSQCLSGVYPVLVVRALHWCQQDLKECAE